MGYTYIGNLEDQDNTPVKEDLLKKSLEKRGYTKDQISKAVTELVTKAGNQADTLYQINKEVYSLLRYGKQGVKDDDKKRIWVNLQLAKKPVECLEYVVIHELVHLIEKNHTHKFHSLVDEYCPTWKEARKLLTEMPLDYFDQGEQLADEEYHHIE